MEKPADSENRQNGNDAWDENQDKDFKQKDDDNENIVEVNSVKEKNASVISVRKRSSTLKRKKIIASHLTQHAPATISVRQSQADNTESRKVKEVRSKPINTKQTVQPKRDILQQKYQELHQLLVLPLVQPINKNVLNIGQFLHLQDGNNDVILGSEQDTTHFNKIVTDKNEKNVTKLNHSQKPSEQETKCGAGANSFNDEGYIQWVRKNKNKPHNNINEEKQEKQMQEKKQISQPSDTFLKNTNNPMIKQWLKRKEREIRWRKREERKQLKAERLKKQEQEMLRQEKFKDSGQKVREWMMQKRKEIVRGIKENTVQENDKIKYSNLVDTEILPPPEGSDTSSAAHGVMTFNISLEPNKQSAQTSFVYARPVSGRVRLIKLQKESKENAKRKELEKQLIKEQLEKEKTKKMRVSYDQWLLRKREEDYAKRQEAARMRALAKSDSELDNIGVDLAQKRIKSFMRKKQNFDNELNHSLKDEDFCHIGEQKNRLIKVLGSKKSLNIRPSSARCSVSPRISKSIHRPLSANPASTFLGQDSNNQEKTIYKVPYPPEKGAPKYILDKQRKLFSPHLTSINGIVQHVSSNEINVTSENNQTNDDQQNGGSTEIKLEPFMTNNTQETKIIKDEDNYDFNKNFIESKEQNIALQERNQMVKNALNSDVESFKVNESQDTQKLTILEQIVNCHTLTDDTLAADQTKEIVHCEVNSKTVSAIKDVNVFDSNLELNLENKPEVNITKDDTLTGVEEILDLSVSKNSGKHVSFQDSPVIFESSDTEISSEFSEYNEIEEVLSDENDNF
ncbi:hypothetical protein Btru_006226 [Bulinus truncatus]|nr:hypothetical protein Btru_006226 [Bulinus truncatus]